MIKKISSFVMSLILAAGLAAPAFAAGEAPRFTDVPTTYWGYPSIEQAVEQGWLKGYPDKTFRPSKSVSYAEMSLMVTQAFFPEELAAYAGPKPAWYTPACTVANSLGLYAGTAAEGRGTEAAVANQKMARYEMAQLVYNALRAAGAEAPADVMAAPATTPDWDTVPVRYRIAVAAAKGAGIVKGVDKAGTFDGGSPMSRAHAAVVLVKMDKVIAAAEKPEKPTVPETPIQTSSSFTVTTPELRFVTGDGTHWDSATGNFPEFIRITSSELGLENSIVYHSIYPFTFESSDEDLVFVNSNGEVQAAVWGYWAPGIPAKQTYITVTNTKDGTTAQVKVTLERVPEEEVPTVESGYTYLADDAYIAEYAAEMLRLCNASRAQIGVAPLKYMENVQDIINIRAEELFQSRSHTRPNGKAFTTFFKDYGYTAHARYTVAENFAGTPNVRQIGDDIYLNKAADTLAFEFFDTWFNSPGHRGNFQNYEHKYIAVGLAFDPSKDYVYSVQQFSMR